MNDGSDFFFRPPIRRPAPTGGPFDRLDRQRRQTTLVLDGSVGQGGANDPQDVRNAKRALALAGFFPEERARFPSSRADAMGEPDFEAGIRAFQRAFGLAEDGVMNPRGESEAALNGVVESARSADADEAEPPAARARSPESIEAPPQEEPKDPAARPPREEDPCQPIVENIEFINRRLNALGDKWIATNRAIGDREARIEELEALSPGDPFPGEPEQPREMPEGPIFRPPDNAEGDKKKRRKKSKGRDAAEALRDLLQHLDMEWRRKKDEKIAEQRKDITKLQEQLKEIQRKKDNLNRNLEVRAEQLNDCRRGLFVPPSA